MPQPIRYYPDNDIKAALLVCVLDGYNIDSPAFNQMTLAELFELTNTIIARHLPTDDGNS